MIDLLARDSIQTQIYTNVRSTKQLRDTAILLKEGNSILYSCSVLIFQTLEHSKS